MNISKQKDSSDDFRQRDLQRQIFDALNVEDRERFLFFQSQWVHRYGLETLPDEEQLRNLFKDEALISSSSMENGSDSRNSLIGNNEKITLEENSYLEEINDSEEILILSEKQSNQESENKLEDKPNKIDNEEIKSQIENSLNQKELKETGQVINNDSDKKEVSNKKENTGFNTDVAEEEFIRIPPPPPPSLNKLRRWLN